MRSRGGLTHQKSARDDQITSGQDMHADNITMQALELSAPELGVSPMDKSLSQANRGNVGGQNSQAGSGDALIFIAMGLVSAALGLGLYAHLGFNFGLAVLSGLALFATTSCLHVFVRRMQGVDLLDHRVTVLEGAVAQLGLGHNRSKSTAAAMPSDDLDRVIARATERTPPSSAAKPAGAADAQAAPQQIDTASNAPIAKAPSATTVSEGAGAAKVEPASKRSGANEIAEPERRATPENQSTFIATKKPGDQTGPAPQSPSSNIDGLVRQLARELGGKSKSGQNAAAARPQPNTVAAVPEPQVPEWPRFDSPTPVAASGEVAADVAAIGTPVTGDPANAAAVGQGGSGIPNDLQTPAADTAAAHDTMPPAQITEPAVQLTEYVDIPQSPVIEPPVTNDPIAQAIREAAESGAVDIYLQPILSIDDRKVRFFEVLGRVKASSGEIIATENNIEISRSIGVLTLLDRAVLVRAARLLKKLAARRQAQPLFCNLSRDSLNDVDFMREFAEFMGGFRDVAPYMIIEINQAAIAAAEPATVSGLKTLAQMGFRLSLDDVGDVATALATAKELEFSFLKLPYETFLAGSDRADPQSRALAIHAAARDIGLTVIVDRIERKDELEAVIKTGVGLGQGYLFSEPKPLLPQVAAEVAGDSVAA